jgi:membrane-associated protease RseP (regulator of RpoE activity)
VNVFIAIFGLAFLVLIHEAGHFFTARLVGMRPRRFFVGFPPPVVSVKRKGIEYGIGAIPLGGYVKIPGMHRPAPSDLDVHFGQAIREVPELLPRVESAKRAVGRGDLDAAQATLPGLERAVAEARLTPGGRRIAERGVRELADALSSDAYWRQKPWKKIAVIFAGPGTNLLLAIVIFTVILVVATGGYRVGFVLTAKGTKVTGVVDAVLKDSPAERIGLRHGDRLVAIDGRPVTPLRIHGVISGSRGAPLTLTVIRKGTRLTLGPVSARKQTAYSVPHALWESVRQTGFTARDIGRSLVSIVHGQGRKQIASPVGIVRASSQAAHQGWLDYLNILGFISLSLALLNLLPLLPLDGGHIAFSIVEAIRGRAVGREVYERVSAVGLALVLLLFFIGLSNDVGGSSG